MNDFDYDVLQKKRIARNAKYQKKGSRSKKCTLPDDYLTPAQRKALNGPIKTYKLGEPMDWGTFRSMPDDLQREYMTKLIDRFHASDTLLGEMFGVQSPAVCKRRNELGITRAVKVYPTEAQRKAFRDWFNGVEKNANEQEVPEQEPTASPEPVTEIASKPGAAPDPRPLTRVTSGSFTVSGAADEALELLRMMFRDDHHTGTFTLIFTFDEEDING